MANKSGLEAITSQINVTANAIFNDKKRTRHMDIKCSKLTTQSLMNMKKTVSAIILTQL